LCTAGQAAERCALGQTKFRVIKMSKNQRFYNLVIFILLYGCSTIPESLPLPTLYSTRTQTLPTQTPTSIYAQYWVEFREPVDGWGIAVPANWWLNKSYEMNDDFDYLQIMNYNISAFDNEIGRKVWRDWAYKKSIKIEIFKITIIDELDSLEQAIRERIEKEEIVELVEIETININGELSVRYVLRGGMIDGAFIIYAFRINQSSYLQLSCYPNTAYERLDVQAIINSIVIRRNVKIVFPNVTPEEPIIYIQ
jgi:hypothetical protein